MLDIELLKQQLGGNFSVEYHAEVSSTNELAMDMARAGADSGQLIVADFQTSGRGRRGARWEAPAGSSVLCSLLLRTTTPLPPHHLAILSGVGVANALATLGHPVKIKWPNDIMLQDRKIAGILVETTGNAVVLGIGINCTVNDEDFPEAIRGSAGSLHAFCDTLPARERIIASVAHSLCDTLARVEAGGIIKVLYQWNTLNWLARRKVRVSGPFGVIDGDGLFLDGRTLHFHVFKNHGVVPMPLSCSVEAR